MIESTTEAAKILDRAIKSIENEVESNSNHKNETIKTEVVDDIPIDIRDGEKSTQFNNSAEQMIAIQSFSHDYYQLLVTCEEDVFINNMITIASSRALSKNLVPPEIFKRCSTLSEEGIKELKTFPAIICQENTDYRGITDSHQKAIYAYIKKVQICDRDIKIAFQPISTIRQQTLCDSRNSIFFDLNMDCAITDLNRCAWSVHKTNLFEAFNEAGIKYVPMPSKEI